MGLRNRRQFGFCFGEGDIKTALVPAYAFQQELQGQRGLADAGIALDQVQAVGREPAAENIVQPRYSCRQCC